MCACGRDCEDGVRGQGSMVLTHGPGLSRHSRAASWSRSAITETRSAARVGIERPAAALRAWCQRGSVNTGPPDTRAHSAHSLLLSRYTHSRLCREVCSECTPETHHGLLGRNIVTRKGVKLGVWTLRLQFQWGVNKSNSSNITASDANIVKGALPT